MLSDETKFFLFLLECYAAHKNRSTGEILREWDTLGITQPIFDRYFRFHTERLENAYEEIDRLTSESSSPNP